MKAPDGPLVSVITPARNMERFLRATMQSVLEQTLRDFEYLVVDNASDDATASIVESFARRDARVRLLYEPTLGSGAARNRGLAEARGRYLAFVDGDDEWLPAKLEIQVRQLSQLPSRYAGVFCRSVTTTELGDELYVYRPPAGTYDRTAFLAWCNPAGNGSSFLVRREAYEQAGGFDEQLTNLLDMEWLLRLLRDSEHPLLQGTVNELVRYRQRRGSISTDSNGRMEALEDVIARFDDQHEPFVWLRPALMAYRAGCPAHGRRWARRAAAAGWGRLLRSPDGRKLLLHTLRTTARGGPGRNEPAAGPTLRPESVPAAVGRSALAADAG